MKSKKLKLLIISLLLILGYVFFSFWVKNRIEANLLENQRKIVNVYVNYLKKKRIYSENQDILLDEVQLNTIQTKLEDAFFFFRLIDEGDIKYFKNGTIEVLVDDSKMEYVYLSSSDNFYVIPPLKLKFHKGYFYKVVYIERW